MACFGRLMRKLQVANSREEICEVTESLSNLGWSFLVQPRQIEQVFQGLVSLSFEYLQEWWVKKNGECSLGNICQHLTTLIGKRLFLHPLEFSCFNLCSLFHFLSLFISEFSLTLSSLICMLSGCRQWDLSLAFSSSYICKNQAPSASPCLVLQSPNHLSDFPAKLLQCPYCNRNRGSG